MVNDITEVVISVKFITPDKGSETITSSIPDAPPYLIAIKRQAWEILNQLLDEASGDEAT